MKAATIFPTSYVMHLSPIFPGWFSDVFGAVFAHQLCAFAHLQRRSCVENTLAAMDGLIERTSATLIDTYPPSKSEIAQVKPQFLHKEILQFDIYNVQVI